MVATRQKHGDDRGYLVSLKRRWLSLDTKKRKDLLNLYAALIQEVKIRLFCINDTLNKPPKLPEKVVVEFYFLQLRMICELIAIACLVAHGEKVDKNAKSLKKKYKADEIVNKLEQLEPDFYPHPHQMSQEENGDFHLGEIGIEYLKKEDLIKLYRSCGSQLHRGNLKNLLKSNVSSNKEHKEIYMWFAKIISFLNVHSIGIEGAEVRLLCQIGARNERVQVGIIEAKSEN